MLAKLLRFVLYGTLFIALPYFSYFSLYQYTDHFFQTTKRPYPFELFGMIYGLGAVAWTLAAGVLILMLFKLFRRKKTTPRIVQEKQKIDEVEILK